MGPAHRIALSVYLKRSLLPKTVGMSFSFVPSLQPGFDYWVAPQAYTKFSLR